MKTTSILVAALFVVVSGAHVGVARAGIFDSTTWSPATTFPTDGYQYDAVEYNGYIYVIGGYNGIVFDSAYVAKTNPDGSLGTWTATTPLPEADQGPGVTVWDGHIYVGLHNGNVYWAAINTTDGTLDAWQGPTIAAAWHGGRLLIEAHSGYLYIFGGWHLSTFYADVYVAPINGDGSLGTWSPTTSMPQPRQHQSVHFFNNRVYIVGGITSGLSILNSVYSAPANPDGTLGAWRPEANLPHALWYHNSVSIAGRIYLFGGRTGYSTGSEAFNIYESEMGPGGTITRWKDVRDVPGQYPLAMGAVYVPSNARVYLIGGSGSGLLTDAVWSSGGIPIPTISEWGVAAMTLLLMTGLTIVFARRRKSSLSCGH